MKRGDELEELVSHADLAEKAIALEIRQEEQRASVWCVCMATWDLGGVPCLLCEGTRVCASSLLASTMLAGRPMNRHQSPHVCVVSIASTRVTG